MIQRTRIIAKKDKAMSRYNILGKLTFAIGSEPLNLRRIDESIPFGFRQLEFLIRMKRLLKCRANFLDRFFTIVGLERGVAFVMFLICCCNPQETLNESTKSKICKGR